jgi:hypothetical protein
MQMISRLIRIPSAWRLRPRFCENFGKGFLVVAFLGLAAQVAYDRHPLTIIGLFPQWLLLGAIWYAWQPSATSKNNFGRGTLAFALFIPILACLTLVLAWLGWKANLMAICGVVPISDSASYYISAQTLLRDAFLDAAAQRRPLNIVMTTLWLYLSADHFRLLLFIQALCFSAAAFLASAAVAGLHGFRAGLLLFAFLLVFAEPYLPTTLSETNGIIFGILALVGFLFGIYRKSFFSYCFGAFLLAVGLAIRPSALIVLPCVVVAGANLFGRSRMRLVAAVAALMTAVVLPSGISILLNRTMSHGEGGFNANLSYTIYGLVAGGKGWEQYEKDYPRTLAGLPDAERSHVVLEAAKRHFNQRPSDLARGLVKGQALGPLQTFFQIVRLAFLGAAGDPLRIIPSLAIVVLSVYFALVLLCPWTLKSHGTPASKELRVFCTWMLLGYLISIPFFYKDGGLRLHAALLPLVSYMLLWVLLRPAVAAESALSGNAADRLLAGTTAFAVTLLVLGSWISLTHPQGRQFNSIPVAKNPANGTIQLWFKPGWPQCDLRRFAYTPVDDRPRWFSGAIPDDDYRSAGIRDISGKGDLFFGFDPAERKWRIIHSEERLGLLNSIRLGSNNQSLHPDNKYRDYYSAETVEIIVPQ